MIQQKYYNGKAFKDHDLARNIELSVINMINNKTTNIINVRHKLGDKYNKNDAIVNVNQQKEFDLELECIGIKEHEQGNPLNAYCFGNYGIFGFEKTWAFAVSILERKLKKLGNNECCGLFWHSMFDGCDKFVFIPSFTVNKNFNRFIKVKINKVNDHAYKMTWDLFRELYNNNEIIIDNYPKLERYFVNYSNGIWTL